LIIINMDELQKQTIIDQAPFGFAYHKIVLDAENHPVDYEFIEVNPTFEAITGLKASSIVGKTVCAILPGIREGNFDWVSFYGDIAINNKSKEFEQYSEQLKRWYKVNAFSPGKYYFVTYFVDITSQKVLIESAQQFFQNSEGGINYQKLCDDVLLISGAKVISFNLFEANGMDFTAVAISGLNKYLNKAADLLGFEIVGKKWAHDPARAEKIKDHWITRFASLHELTGSVLPERLISTLERLFGIGEAYVVKIQKDKKMLGDFTIIMNAGTFLQNETLIEVYAKQVGMMIEKVRAEERLRESEDKLSKVGDSALDAVIMINELGNVEYWNPAATKVFGYTKDDIAGKNFQNLIMTDHYKSDHQKVWSNYAKSGMAPPNGKLMELMAKNAEGHEFPIDIALSSINIKNKNWALAYIRDITDRKQAEERLNKYTSEIELKNLELDMALHSADYATNQAREMATRAELANKTKSVFLANMSHEIRTPLNAIIGFSQLMSRDNGLTDSQKDYNQSIIRAGEHLLTLINDILELSKVEAGRVVLNPSNVDLKSLLNDIRMIFKEKAQSKHLQFIFETIGNLPSNILVDDSKLRQIFINLIGNAIKFTDKGQVAVRTRTETTKEGKSQLVVDIQDSGPGIATEELNNLFKHFVQTSSGIKKGSGTGLGLALSRELALLMGGDINVLSEIGRGSVFTFRVEIKKGSDQTPEASNLRRVTGIEKPKPHTIGKTYRILVVDDKEENLTVAVNLLRIVGFETNEAVNGIDAIAKFKEWEPDLILMDMRMPVMDGYDATRIIKSTEKGRQTPIIALTASTFEDERKRTETLQMQGYVRKPFRENELFSTIGKVLGINYIYENETSREQEKDFSSHGKLSEDISKLPNDLVSQMQEAIAVADLDLLIQLIEKIDVGFEDLAKQLLSLAKNYDYNHLQIILSNKEEK